jgi:hypothetical protein
MPNRPTTRSTSAPPAANGHAGAALSLTLDHEALRPLIEAVVTEVLARVEAERARLGGKLCYSEPEAAALLELQPHQLRDERLRGRIRASSIVGRRVRYVREDLVRYLASRRVGGE